MNQVSDKKSELIAKRDELLERLIAIEKDYRQGLDPDSGERAVQLENAEVLDGIARAARDELNSIEEELAGLK